jgi:Na+/melibiose symporter-like transporter
VLGFSALGSALRLLPMTPIMLFVSPQTPRLSARFGAHRVVGAGMLLVAVGFAMFGFLSPTSAYLYVLVALLPFIVGISLTMSPMTASIMSAVPDRRAGAGSAMNDATRELGAALGIAVLGSLAASKYASRLNTVTSHLSATDRHQARASLTDALQVAGRLPHAASVAVQQGAKSAFVDGIHLASIAGVALAVVSTGLVLRYLPHETKREGEAFAEIDTTNLEIAVAIAE